MPAASTPSTVASFSCSWKYGTGALTSILTPRPWPAAAILRLPRLSLGPAAPLLDCSGKETLGARLALNAHASRLASAVAEVANPKKGGSRAP